MTSEDVRRLEELFEQACGLPHNERGRFASSAPVDPALRERLIAMLEADSAADTPLDTTPHAEIAASFTEIPVSVPDRIGSYRVVRLVGEGGMGMVFESQQDSPRRRVALKLLRPGATTSGLLRRFELEAQLLGRLDHPGIAQIHEAGVADVRTNGTTGRQPFFAMEFVDGEPLSTYAQRLALGRRQRIALIADVCDAVQHAHQRGIIHRDLKPGNILVDRQGRAKVLDFGIARVADAVEATTQTAAGQIMGTIPYMSPEQLAGRPGDVDVRSDVYSLGVVLFESLCGQLPHAQGTPLEMARRICEQPPRRPSSIDRSLRGDVEIVVLKALAADRAQRYQSVAELGQDLRRVLADEPITARRTSTWYVIRKATARHPVGAAGLAGFALTVVVSAVALAVLYGNQLTLRKAADEQARLAREARDRAEASALDAQRKLHIAHESALFLMDDVSDRLRRVLGAGEIRKDLLKQVYQRFAPLAEEHSESPELQHDLARLQGKLGNAAVEFGDTEAAVTHYFAAQASLEQLVATHPGQLSLLVTLASVYSKLGDLTRKAADVDGMRDYYVRQYEISEMLFAAKPENLGYVRGLSLACERMAILSASLGKHDDNRAWTRRMHALKLRLVEAEPDNLTHQYELSVAEERLAECARFADDADGVDEHSDAAREIRECLVLLEANNPLFIRALSVSYERLAMTAASRKEPAKDRMWTEKMFELKTRLMALEPANPVYWHDLAICYGRRAGHAREDGDLAESEALLRAADSLYDRLVRADPSVPRYRSDQEWNLKNLDEVVRERAAAAEASRTEPH